MIPIAVIVSDQIPERFETAYASSLYETLPFFEALESDVKSTPTIHYLAQILNGLDLWSSDAKFFVIYNPDPKRIQMALFGDADKLILHVRDQAGLLELKNIYGALRSILELELIFQEFEKMATTTFCDINFQKQVGNEQVVENLIKNKTDLRETIELINKELMQTFFAKFKFR